MFASTITQQQINKLVEDAVTAERERCAKIVERRANSFAGEAADQLNHLAYCIRNGRYVSGELAE